MGAARDYAQAALDRLEDANESGNPPMAALFAQQAQVYATLALVEEQRTANLIAALNGESLLSPHQIGTPENTAWWRALEERMTDRVIQ